MRAISLVFISLMFLICTLPVFQMSTRVFREYKLFGIEQSTPQPAFSAKSFWDGEFQKKFQSWFSEQIGFRGALIRSENQINFSIFDEISSRSPSKIILGKDNYLFEQNYARAYSNPLALPNAEIRVAASTAKELQDLLAARGMAFLVIISPSKATLYSDHLPSTVTPPPPVERSDYETMVHLLKEQGVNFIDGREYLTKVRKETGYPVFPRSGTHWSYYGSCLIAAEAVLNLERQLNDNLMNIDCQKLQWSDEPRYHDRDLAELINIWRPESTYERMPYPESKTIRDGHELRPKVIIVGSSFVWPLLHYFDKHKVFKGRDFYYYFRTNYSFPPSRSTPIDAKRVDWEKKVFTRKAVIIEINETVVNQLGFGFIGEALKALKASS